MGGTHFAPQNSALGSDWRFSFGAALGVKTYLSQHVGLRAQMRLWMSTLSSDSQFWCTLPGGCVIHASNGVFFTQGESSGGLMSRLLGPSVSAGSGCSSGRSSSRPLRVYPAPGVAN